MNDPWDLKTDSNRTDNSVELFHVFCEDEVSEPIYIFRFRSKNVVISIHKGAKSKMANVISAISFCKDSALFDEEGKLNNPEIHVWCVYDRDKDFSNEEEDKKKAIDFDESIKTANSHNIKVAWSNDDFELWILLHFEDVTISEETKNREYYYGRLTEIIKALPNKDQILARISSSPRFNYKDSIKNPNAFISLENQFSDEMIDAAITRAESIDSQWDEDVLNSEKAPCTKMFVLIRELRSVR